jgi:hypothetical protein
MIISNMKQQVLSYRTSKELDIPWAVTDFPVDEGT